MDLNERAAIVTGGAGGLGAATVRHLVTVEHPMGGTTVVEGSRFVLSRTPAAPPRAAPSYGRDNDDVLRDILGYDDEAITALVADGALE